MSAGIFYLKNITRVSRLVLAGSLLASASQAADGPAFSHDISISEVMASIVMPAANVLWEAAYPDSGPDGEVIKGPENDEGWIKVREAAVSLAASTNLLLVPDLPVKDPALAGETPAGELAPQAIFELIKTQNPAWTAWSRVLNASAMQALEAIDNRDLKTLYDITGSLDSSCTSCHQQFWYPEG